MLMSDHKTIEGLGVLSGSHELLFRIPGCCSMLYECHGGSRGALSTPWVAIQDPRVMFNALTLTSSVMKHFLVTEDHKV